jgi:ArsR family transcriptional regulator, lead/cadmium/zinc/bismuth-responsive transcriptional repressor
VNGLEYRINFGEIIVIKHQIAIDETANVPEQIRAAMPKDAEMLLIARTFQALSDPTRCKIILALTRHELCVSDIASIVNASTSGVSHHLKGLKDIRLVKFRRDGNTIYYSIDDHHVGNLFREAISHLDHVYQVVPEHELTTA